MSRETATWLNTNVLVGFTDKRGHAWHYRASDQGGESNHYPGPVPVPDVQRRLFAWTAESRPVGVRLPAELDTATGVDEAGMPYRWETLDDRQAMVRSDTGAVLGLFKDGYRAHQYGEWLLGTVATILDDDLSIGSAGLLKGGAVAWVSVEVPDTITTPEGVMFRPNLLAVTSFDGSLATTYKRVVTNVVCDNTMAAGLAERGQQFKARHSRWSGMRIGEAREALAVVHTIADDFAAEVKQLCATSVSDAQWRAFVEAHVPLPKPGADKTNRGRTIAEEKRGKLHKLYRYDARVSPWAGTAFGVLQAVNTYVHHEQTVRGAGRPERNMLRAVEGGVDDLDQGTAATLAKVLAKV